MVRAVVPSALTAANVWGASVVCTTTDVCTPAARVSVSMAQTVTVYRVAGLRPVTVNDATSLVWDECAATLPSRLTSIT